MNPCKRAANEGRYGDLLADAVVDMEKIREISWSGIPSRFRPTVWRLFLDYEPVNASIRAAALAHKRSDYFDCLGKVFGGAQRGLWTSAQKLTEAQILRDLPRTHSAVLRCARAQTLFEHVLFVWAVRHPASGYVQGMNDLLQPFFFVFLLPHCGGRDIEEVMGMQDLDFVGDEELREIEADCFWCFSKLLDGLQDVYTTDQPGLYKMLDCLERVVARVEPALSSMLKSEEIDYQEFAFRWVNCLLVREFPMKLVFRLWDLYISDYSKISTMHVYVCAAILSYLAPKLTELSHAQFVLKIQSINPNEWKIDDMEMILAQAYVYEKMFSHSPSHLS